jgi:hypothetical protein
VSARRHACHGFEAVLAISGLIACGGTAVNGNASGSKIAVDVRPPTARVLPGGSVGFEAAVTGTPRTGVTWSVQETTGCGSVTQAGVYTAPAATATCHVVATSTADPSKGASATIDVTGSSTPQWRAFSADSPWNTAIPSNPQLEPDSAALIADFMNSSPYGVHLDVNIPGFSIPLFWADGSTPTYQVRADIGGDGWIGNNGFDAVGTMPIPDGATPDPQSDHHLLVVDRRRGMEWGCWNMAYQNGQWHGGLCAASDLSGTGVRVPATLAQPWYSAHGARACGFPLVAGLIRTEEIQAGRIDHALVIAYPHIRAGWFTPPASTAQAANGIGAISSRGIPCGGRIQFDPGVNLDALGLSRSGRIIMLALQEYGAYVGDYSGALSLYAENSPAAQAYWANGVVDVYELRSKIDLSRFRVIRLGTLYDNGNGG